jgi:hypothetical protein
MRTVRLSKPTPVLLSASLGNSLAQGCFQRLLVQDAVITHFVDKECRSTVHSTRHAPHEVALYGRASSTILNGVSAARLNLPKPPPVTTT